MILTLAATSGRWCLAQFRENGGNFATMFAKYKWQEHHRINFRIPCHALTIFKLLDVFLENTQLLYVKIILISWMKCSCKVWLWAAQNRRPSCFTVFHVETCRQHLLYRVISSQSAQYVGTIGTCRQARVPKSLAQPCPDKCDCNTGVFHRRWIH